jgi:hypothetical protein
VERNGVAPGVEAWKELADAARAGRQSAHAICRVEGVGVPAGRERALKYLRKASSEENQCAALQFSFLVSAFSIQLTTLSLKK